MSWSKFSVTASGPDAFRIDDGVLRALRENLPSVASQTIAAVTSEVPGYRRGPQRTRWARTSKRPCRWRSVAS